MTAPSVADKYTLLRQLGKGGMAEVYLARQRGIRGFEKLVVLKRILPDKARNGEFVTMFLDEARTAADLRHPNVVNVFDINRADGTYYMAMEFLNGRDLRHVLKRALSKKQRVPPGIIGGVGAQAAAGLHYAHEKTSLDGAPLHIVHRDVSPQNIIVGFAGEVKVVDFGIAKAEHQNFETQAGRLKGKYAYMSPEHARGERLDGRADQYSLAVVMWELLTRRRLFRGGNDRRTLALVLDAAIEPPRSFDGSIPHGLNDVVMRALSKDRDDRYPTGDAFRAALEDALTDDGVRHSAADIARYMDELFADEVEDEASLSEERIDVGSDLSSVPSGAQTRAEGSGPRRPFAKTRVDVDPPEAPRVFEDDATDTRLEVGTDDVLPPTALPAVPAPAPAAGPPSPARAGKGRRAFVVGALFGGAAAVFALAVIIGIAVGRGQRGGGDGVVILRSSPAGASVFIDDKFTGQVTPHVVRRDVGSVITVRLEKPGHRPAREVVHITTDKPVELHMKLDKKLDKK